MTRSRVLGVGIALVCAWLHIPDAHAGPTKRPVPRYDGREPADDVGDALLWVPRILLSPAYLVSEYVLRRPLGALITAAEKAELPAVLVSIFTFGGSRAGIIPTFLFDFGLDAGPLPSAGLYIFWDEAFAPEHDLRFRVAVGGSDWIELDMSNRIALDERTRLSIDVDWRRRKDQIFAGIGPAHDDDEVDDDEDLVGRYGLSQVSGGLSFERGIGARGAITAGLAVEHYGFFRANCCDDEPLEARVDEGLYPLPPGLNDTHTRLRAEAGVALDTRATRPGDESGVRAELHGAIEADLRGKYADIIALSAELGAYWDVYRNRVIGVRLAASMIEPLNDGGVPFVELAQLGGARPMRAFTEGRLRDRSAVALIVEYRWPIWVFLDGTLFAEIGNVFGAGFEDLSLDALRLSFGLGMRPASREDHPFELLFALGTEPFGAGAELTTMRVVFGTTSGF